MKIDLDGLERKARASDVGAVITPASETPETAPTSALVTVEIDAERVNPGDVVRSHCLTCGVAIYSSVRATSDLCLACWRADLDQKSLPITSAWSPPFVAAMLDERGGLRWASEPDEGVVAGEPVCRATCPGRCSQCVGCGPDHEPCAMERGHDGFCRCGTTGGGS